MMGVLLQSKGNDLRAVATDGHRLVRLTHRLAAQVLAKDVIVPAKALQAVARSFEPADAVFAVSDPQGMGVLFVTPAFVAVLAAARSAGRGRRLVAAAWASLIAVTVPALLYFNTGWVQWGGRFLLDGWPLWLLLAALGLQRLDRRLAVALVLLSVASNLWAVVATLSRAWPGCVM